MRGLCLGLALLLALPSAARAGDPGEARALSMEGDRLFQLGRFDRAADAYERAYALDARPAFLHNIALAHRRQYDIDGKPEHLRTSREVYRNYLKLDPTTPRRAAVEAIIRELTAKIDREVGPASPEARPITLTSAPPVKHPAPTSQLLGTPAPAPAEEPASRLPWILGGAAVAVTAAAVALVLATRPSGRALDGPVVDLSGMRR